MHPTASGIFKDSYLVEFLDLPREHSENDLHRGLDAESYWMPSAEVYPGKNEARPSICSKGGSTMKIAIDPGHGMGNRRAGVFDPGATRSVGTETFAEADIVLRYGHTLRQLLEDGGIDVFMTRTSSADPAPVGRRARRAAEAGCTHYVSLHLNSSESLQANGVEVLFRNELKDKPLADRLQGRLLQITGFSDHGNDQRTDLAVLRFTPGPAVLIELGFISNDGDRSFLIQGANRDAICQGIFVVLTSGG